MTRVLIIDDDVDATARLRCVLQEEGFRVDAYQQAPNPFARRAFDGYSLIIVDVMSERVKGLDGLRHIRANSALPVLVLTALGDEAHLIAGLDIGADDYVVKPCRPREVVARVRALLRRTRVSAALGGVAEVLSSGGLAMWPGQRRAEWRGEPLKLTSTEFNLLEVLLREVGRPVSKTDLSIRALGRAPVRYERSIDVHLCSVRRKLGVRPDGRPRIQAVYLHGYQLLKE